MYIYIYMAVSSWFFRAELSPSVLALPGLARHGLAKPGPGLARPGLARLGQAWPGQARPGLAPLLSSLMSVNRR